MNESLVQEYVIVNNEIEALTKKKEELRQQIMQNMKAIGEDKLETSLGKFTISKLKKWTYPESIKAIGELFDAEKAKAQSTGDATYIEEESLRFTKVTL